MEDVRLNEMDQEEMWEISRLMRPDLTREEFDRDWAEFAEEKRKRSLS